MKKWMALWAVVGLLVGGCGTTGGGGTSTPIASGHTAGASNCVAVCIGLTAVDPVYYGGWSGDCPGCDIDANTMYGLVVRKGFTADLLLNSVATWENVRAVILNEAKNLKPGDLLAVTMSGHGGQLADDNGDEADGLDETICLWDGQVRDDEVLKMIGELPPGIRMVMINDQCHSEGNFKTFLRMTKQAVSLGAWGKKQAKALIRKSSPWSGQLIQFAGCREASYSYGADSGGTWTTCLNGAYKDTLTWRQWFDAAASKMPSEQVPVWVEYGNVQDSFRNGVVLE